MKKPTWIFLSIAAILFLQSSARSAEANPQVQDLIRQARAKSLWKDPYWSTLLHYRRNIWRVRKSDFPDPRFFLSPKGRTNLQAEMEAGLAAFFEPAGEKPAAHPQCRFIARYQWLKKALEFPKDMTEQDCERFKYWRDETGSDSLSLIFSSYYMNNPGSMYGHTFLKINKADGPGADLMNYTINYAAEIRGLGILYPIRGLAGGYRGQWAVMPYYIKVQQYNNMESRDLWEYKLRFKSEEVDKLFYHLWELQDLNKPYYFFNKNCSYELLPLLDTADPALQLSRGFTYRVIPVDTLQRIVETPGLVQEIKFRPSQLRLLLDERESMAPEERALAKKIADGGLDPSAPPIQELPPEKQAKILDVAYALLKFQNAVFAASPLPVRARVQKILVQRSKLPAGPPAPQEPAKRPVAPHEAHKSGRFGFGAGRIRNGKGYQELSIRPALHDLAENPQGYLSSQLEMLHLKVRHEDTENRFYLSQFSMVNIAALPPYDSLTRPMSWTFRLDVEPAFDLALPPWQTESLVLGGGPGLTLGLGRAAKSKVYVLAQAEAAAGSGFDENYRVGLGGTAGMVYGAGRHFWGQASATVLRYPAGNVGNRVRWQVQESCRLGKQYMGRLTLQRDNDRREWLISLFRYY